jgi:hypothetical protein
LRIDTQGIDTPLVAESIVQDGNFQPCEAWTFIVQDWRALPGVVPALPIFGSIVVGGTSVPDPAGPLSTASIVAVLEPGTWATLAAGLGVLGAAASRQRSVRHDG